LGEQLGEEGMANPQPVQMLAALTKERSSEIRNALLKMKIDIDENDIVDIDEVDLQKLKKQIADDTPPRRQGVAAKEVGVAPLKKEKEGVA
jgi:hypothetical protein